MTHFLDIPAGYRWLITLVFIGIIIVLSVTPDRGLPGDSIFSWLVVNTAPPIQKLLHVVCYAMIAALWAWTLDAVEPRPLRLAIALTLTIGLGAVLEWYQTQIPGRFGTLADVMLNSIGALAGLIVAIVFL